MVSFSCVFLQNFKEEDDLFTLTRETHVFPFLFSARTDPGEEHSLPCNHCRWRLNDQE
jgi:hypothetical protein